MYTPGPWTSHGNTHAATPLVEASGRIIARMPGTTETDEANARLIAAAPKLLEALETMVEQAELLWQYGKDKHPAFYELSTNPKALAAIREAKGE